MPVKGETVTEHNIQESRLHAPLAGSKPVSQTESIRRDPEQAFSRHAKQLEQRYGFGLDAAKADGIIALTMAQTGWQPEEVTAALTTRRLNTDLPAHDVPAYAEKLTKQAFGKASKEAAIERNDAMDLGR